MAEILTCDQMRALEQAAISSGAVTGLELMERAGRGVVDAILGRWPDMAHAPKHAAVLCGPGNNGGDGFVIARLLHQRGWQITLFFYGAAKSLPPDARQNHDLWQQSGEVLEWSADAVVACRADLYVDALFGTGLTRPPPDEIMAPIGALFAAAQGAGRRVAVDAPTGLNLDTGAALGSACGAASADLTVTFHGPKPGHYLAEGPAFCGALGVVDIGLSSNSPLLQAEPAAAGEGASGGGVSAKLKHVLRRIEVPRLPGKSVGHKYNYGHVLVLSGASGCGGAARLAARAALRVGAGLVTVGFPSDALAEHAARLDAIMLRAVDGARDLMRLLEDPRIGTLVLGPGLGLDRARELVPVALAAGRGTVLDADALTAFAQAPSELFEALHPDCVLTPHEGEFARLFPDLDLADPLNAVGEAAARAGCTVLLKGPATLIAAPDGRRWLHPAVYEDAAPWLATAGSGDVLAGIIAGRLAQTNLTAEAACEGAWLHAAAARQFGPGMIAEDLPEQLPAVFRDLGL